MAFIVYLSETNIGRAVFNSKEEAEEWMEEPDYDFVKWLETTDSNMQLIEE